MLRASYWVSLCRGAAGELFRVLDSGCHGSGGADSVRHAVAVVFAVSGECDAEEG